MNKNSGFSLIEVMIAVGVLSVVTLGIMRINDNLISVQQGMEQSQDSLEILSNTKLFMGHQLSCMGVFKQAKAKRSDGKPYIPMHGEFQSIKNFEDNDFLSIGDRYGKLTLESLSFGPHKGYFKDESFMNKRGLINVFIKLKGIGKVKMVRTKTVPVWVYARKKLGEAAEIQYCDSSRSDMVNYITESVMARVCISFNAVLDPETRLCVFGSKEEKRAAIKTAQKVTEEQVSRDLSSRPVVIDENKALLYLMKAMMEEDEEGDQ